MSKKLTKSEIRDHAMSLADLTLETTQVYFETTEKKEVDKQMWAFLHIGYVNGLMAMGISIETAQKITEMTMVLIDAKLKESKHESD